MLCDSNSHLIHPLLVTCFPIMKEVKAMWDRCKQVETDCLTCKCWHTNDGRIGRRRKLAKFGQICHQHCWSTTTATRADHVLANVRIIFATQLLLHETSFQSWVFSFRWCNNKEVERMGVEHLRAKKLRTGGKSEWSPRRDEEICMIEIEGGVLPFLPLFDHEC